MRIRIAKETADALAYMHSITQIIHRDIKSANILLNEFYTAKVSDFGISKLVPSGQNHLTTLVQGTYGYIDLEYFDSGNLTEKSDVYSFGVILIELLTGEKALSLERPQKDRSLAKYFISSLEDDRLLQVLEDRVKSEGNVEQLGRVAELAKKCLNSRGEKRPTMEEVKNELVELSSFQTYSLAEIQINLQEREPLLIEPLDYYDSTRNQAIFEMDSMRNPAVFDMDKWGSLIVNL